MKMAEHIYIDDGYRKACEYKEKHGSLAPMSDNEENLWGDKVLSKHLNAVISEYKKKNHGILTENFIDRYKKLGLDFTIDGNERPSKEDIQKALNSLKLYYKENGNLDIKRDSGFFLPFNLIRCEYFEPDYGYLDRNIIDELNKMGMAWMNYNGTREQWLSLCDRYYAAYGNINVPAKYITEDNMRLGTYMSNEKKRYATQKMNQSIIEKYESMGIIWSQKKKRTTWEDFYRKAKASYKKYGYVNEDDPELSTWCKELRLSFYTKNPARISKMRVKKMNELEFIWSKSWRNRYFALMEYEKEHGSAHDIPYDYKTANGLWLGAWTYLEKDRILNDPEIEEYKIKAFIKIGVITPEEIKERNNKIL